MKQGTPLALVRNPGEPHAESSVDRTADGSVIVNRIVYQAAPDELRPVAALAAEWGVEPAGLLRAASRASLTVKIGRQTCARRSDLLRLVELMAKPKAAPVSTDPKAAYAALVASRGTR